MIALLVESRCTSCNSCVNVCPMDVFEKTASGPPIIARPDACETCFLCELYCKDDALYVDPDCRALHAVNAEAIIDAGHLGRYRRESGWDEFADNPAYANEHWRMEEVFLLARASRK